MNTLLFKKIFPSLLRAIDVKEKILFLTFDDGPLPEITPWVLHALSEYKAKATFFCIGENIQKNPEIFKRIIDEGHAVGNHTFHHLNGWKTNTKEYLKNIEKCDLVLQSTINNQQSSILFRPPYGKLKPSQISTLKTRYSIVMWDVLTRDWEQKLSGNECFERVKKKAKPGSIIVFHDSKKAEARMKPALESTLSYYSNLGYKFETLTAYL